MARITRIERYGDTGWTWTVVYTDVCGIPQTRDMRTNIAGEGMFTHDGTGAQSAGTVQFSLPNDEPSAVRALRLHYARRGMR